MKCGIAGIIFIASLVFLQQTQAEFLEPECGAQRISKRVVNGTDAEKGLYPWMAYIHRRHELVCGGTLINHWFVLTAAHCLLKPKEIRKDPSRLHRVDRFVKHWRPKELKVGLDVHNSSELDPSRLYRVDRFFKHERYISFERGNDIALLKLARKVEFSATVRPICILTYSNLKVHRSPWFLAIGWGRTMPYGNNSLILQTKILERRDISECDGLDTEICTVAESGTVCSGDSGGPLVREKMIQGKSHFVQLGVASYVRATDFCRRRAVFTKVLSHTEWIQSTVEMN